MAQAADHNCGIYRIVNTRNGKFYVGSSSRLLERKSDHFSFLKNNRHPNSYLQNAYAVEQSKEVFKFEVIAYCRSEDLIEIEQRFLDYLAPAYNLSGIAGKIEHTEIVRKKMSDAKKGKPGARKGFKSSPETGAKISASKKGLVSPKKGLATGRSSWNLGISKTEEEKQILRLKCSGWTHTEKAKSRIREVARNPSVETRAKLSAAAKKRRITPELGAKISAAVKGIPRPQQSGLNHWRVQYKAAQYYGA